MKTQPKVSVVIPVYNAQDYLRECLGSILNQSLKELEVICVDDESKDNSLSILREYEENDPRVVVIDQKNQGAGAARNHGLQLARGEYVHFMDADDYVAEGAYEAMYSNAAKHNADVVKTRAYAVNEQTGELVDNKTYVLPGVGKKDFYRVISFAQTPKLLSRDISMVPWNGLYKRTFLLEHQILFNGLKCVNDRSFYNHVIMKAERVVLIPDYTVYHRTNIGTSLVGQRAKYFECHFESYKIIEAQCAHLPDEQKALILAGELSDMFTWYRRYKIDEHYGEEIKQKLKQFLDTLDFDFFTQNRQNTYWRKDWLEVTTEYNSELIKREPKVSVVIPVYNAAPYLHECLDSLISQTMKNIQIICVDDGSTDESLSILQEYERLDARITVLCQQNQFAGVARNHGMSVACGKYLLFLDADDFFDPAMLEKAYQRIEEHSADVCIFGAQVYNQGTGQFSPMTWAYRPELCPSMEEPFSIDTNADYILNFAHAVPWNKLLRREFVEHHKLRFQATRYANDIAFVHSSLALAQKIILLDEPLLTYRMNNNTSLQGNKDVAPLSFCEALRELRNRLKMYGVYEKAERSFTECTLRAIGHNMNTLKNRPVFEKTYQYVKGTVMEEFGLIDKPKTYFSKFSQKEYDKSRDILKLSSDEYIKKYRMFQTPPDPSVVPSTPATSIGKASPAAYEQRIHTLENQLTQSKRRTSFLERELKNIRSSWSYRCGRAVTWLPRKLRGGIRCFREHGLRYTWNQIWLHLKGDKTHTPKKDSIQKQGNPIVSPQISTATNSPSEKKEPPKKPVKVGRYYNYDYYNNLPHEQYPEEMKIWYKLVMKEVLDLENPKTFNEKIQWLKLYDSTELKTLLADKYRARDWIKERIGGQYLIPLLGAWDRFDDIEFDRLPDQFVLKANHGSGWNLIVTDKSQMDIAAAKEKFDTWMSQNFAFVYGFQPHYMNIPPKIVAEQYMADLAGDIFDYRFFCFNGVPHFVWVDIGSGTSHHKRNVYDLEWKLQDYKVNYPQILPEPKRPECFDAMISLVRELCREFAFVRVDFYCVNGKIYFGEMTFTPQSGTGRWESEEHNRLYGDLLQLPPKSPLPERKIWR